MAVNALNANPRDVILPMNSPRAPSEETNASRSAWGASDQLPVATSTEDNPRCWAKSSAASNGRWLTESVINPIFMATLIPDGRHG